MIEAPVRMLKDTLTTMALQTDLYRLTSLRQWERHLDFCLKRDQVELLHYAGKLVGFATWYLTNDLKKQTMEESGLYCHIPFFCVLPEYRHRVGVKDFLQQCVERNEEKLAANCTDYVVWQRPDRYTKRNKYWLGLKRTQGGWKCTKLWT